MDSQQSALNRGVLPEPHCYWPAVLRTPTSPGNNNCNNKSSDRQSKCTSDDLGIEVTFEGTFEGILKRLKEDGKSILDHAISIHHEYAMCGLCNFKLFSFQNQGFLTGDTVCILQSTQSKVT